MNKNTLTYFEQTGFKDSICARDPLAGSVSDQEEGVRPVEPSVAGAETAYGPVQ